METSVTNFDNINPLTGLGPITNKKTPMKILHQRFARKRICAPGDFNKSVQISKNMVRSPEHSGSKMEFHSARET